MTSASKFASVASKTCGDGAAAVMASSFKGQPQIVPAARDCKEM
jgi:hypothetical protein